MASIKNVEIPRNEMLQKSNSSAPPLQQQYSYISLIIWAIGLSKPYRKWVVIILIAMVVETVMSLASPWPLKIIIDNVIGHKALPHWLAWINYLFTSENKIQLAAVVAILFVAINAIGALAGYIDSYYNESVAQYVANDLRQKLYHHLQRLSLTYYDTHESSKLLSTITADVSTIQDFASSTMLTIVVDTLTIAGMFVLMFYLHPGFTILALAVTPLLILFVSRFKKTIKKATREVRRDQSNMFAVIQNGLESIRSVNAFGRQHFEEDKLDKASHATIDASLKARRIKSALSPVVTLMVSVCTSLVIWRGADLVLTNVMTIGTLTVFLWYMNKFFSPIQDLAKMTSNVAQATVALERIQSILDTDIITPEKPNATNPGKLSGNIVFENVSFAYSPDTTLLQGINMQIHCGQRIGICGPTGCGKSTIVSLIARFYDVNGGRILIDNNDITNLQLDGLRSQIGYVLQDTFLFYGTIKDNIAYGRPDATDEEIIEASKLAYAHEFIIKMPLGYETLVGERGATLSGGQRQRIGIARAVVRNSPILILDEPTAALDSESEQIVMAALENLMAGRTVITIAHRLSTISDADQIIVLNNGLIAEQGTHKTLMEKNEIYAGLYTNQSRSGHAFHKAILQ